MDKPVYDVGRILRALRLWLWWVAVMEFDMPFWKFMYYHERPDASHKAGFY